MPYSAAPGARCTGFVRGRGDVRKEGGEVPARRPSSPPLAWVARRAEGCGTGSVRGRGAPCRSFSDPGRRRLAQAVGTCGSSGAHAAAHLTINDAASQPNTCSPRIRRSQKPTLRSRRRIACRQLRLRQGIRITFSFGAALPGFSLRETFRPRPCPNSLMTAIWIVLRV